jgi:TRAP-type C4-dicarboxylate transport system permease small subunit
MLREIYFKSLKALVYALVFVSGLCVFMMIGIICADVILRRFDHPIKGAYDMVKIAGAVTLASALPYTTAVKGHVAIEYFFHKLNRTGRVVVDSVVRLLGIGLFAFLSWRSFIYGLELRRSGQVAQTLEVLPIFWVPWIIAFCCLVVILVIVYNMIHPGREMIKP